MSLVGALASQEPNQITKEQIAAIVLLSLSFIVFSYLHQMLNIASIFFTPMSFKTVNPWHQSALTYTTAIICFLGEFSGHYRNKTVSIILMAVCFFLYIFLFLIMEFHGHFLNSFQASFFGAVTIGCCSYTILSIIFFFLNKAMPEYIIIIVIFVVFVSAIAISYHRSHRCIKSIQLLNSLEESQRKKITKFSKEQIKFYLIYMLDFK